MSTTYLSAGAENVSAPAPCGCHGGIVGQVPRAVTSSRVVIEAPAFEELSQSFPHLEIVALIRRDEGRALYLARYCQTRSVVFLEIMPQTFHRPFAQRVKALLTTEQAATSRLCEFGRFNGFVYLVFERKKWRLLRSIASWFCLGLTRS